MENVLPVYATVAVLALGFLVFHKLRNDETYPRKLAKIRVPIDESRRKQPAEPPEEESGSNLLFIRMLVAAISVIFVLLLLQAM